MPHAFPKTRLIIFCGAFASVVFADWVRFTFLDGVEIVNWTSFAHPAWVIGTLTLLFIGIFWTGGNRHWWTLLFWLHLLVVVAALANQYLAFWDLLTYNCILFNLIFTALYFVVSAPRQSRAVR